MLKTKILSHQLEALKLLFKRGRLMVSLPTGSGKTLLSLIASIKYLDNGVVDKVVWVTLPVLKGQVESEFSRFFEDEYLRRYSIGDTIGLSKNKRVSVYNDTPDILVLSHYILDKDINYIKSYMKRHRCFLVIDEAHMAKNYNAKITRRLSTMSNLSHRLIALTATPLYKNLEDVLNILRNLSIFKYPKDLFYKNFVIYKDIRIGFNTIRKVFGYKNIDKFIDLVGDRIFFKDKSELFDLPKVSMKYYFVDDSFAKNAVNAIKDNNYSLTEIAYTAPAIITKNSSHRSDKIEDYLKFIINDVDKPVVYTTYKTVANYIGAWINKYTDYKPIVITGYNSSKSIQLLEEFSSKNKSILVANDVITTGLDGIHKISNNLVLMNVPNSIGKYTQLIGRFMRIGGSFNSMFVHLLFTDFDLRAWIRLHIHASISIKSGSPIDMTAFDSNLLSMINDEYTDKISIDSVINKVTLKFKGIGR